MAVKGAELLCYPTAIGSDCHDHWQRVMQGHAAANIVPVIASNRVGVEEDDGVSTTFYGRSFIADHTGAKIAEAGADEQILIAEIDLDATATYRRSWGLFRDRRPELYGPIVGQMGE